MKFLIDYQKEIEYRLANTFRTYLFIVNNITKILTSVEGY